MPAGIFSSGVVVSTQKKSHACRKRTTLVVGRLLDTCHSSASLQSAISKRTWKKPTRAWEDEIARFTVLVYAICETAGSCDSARQASIIPATCRREGPDHAQTKKGLVLNFGMHIYMYTHSMKQ